MKRRAAFFCLVSIFSSIAFGSQIVNCVSGNDRVSLSKISHENMIRYQLYVTVDVEGGGPRLVTFKERTQVCGISRENELPDSVDKIVCIGQILPKITTSELTKQADGFYTYTGAVVRITNLTCKFNLSN